jgi:hypothetical protein
VQAAGRFPACGRGHGLVGRAAQQGPVARQRRVAKKFGQRERRQAVQQLLRQLPVRGLVR